MKTPRLKGREGEGGEDHSFHVSCKMRALGFYLVISPLITSHLTEFQRRQSSVNAKGIFDPSLTVTLVLFVPIRSCSFTLYLCRCVYQSHTHKHTLSLVPV